MRHGWDVDTHVPAVGLDGGAEELADEDVADELGDDATEDELRVDDEELELRTDEDGTVADEDEEELELDSEALELVGVELEALLQQVKNPQLAVVQ